MNSISRVPEEIQGIILSYLNIQDIQKISKTLRLYVDYIFIFNCKYPKTGDKLFKYVNDDIYKFLKVLESINFQDDLKIIDDYHPRGNHNSKTTYKSYDELYIINILHIIYLQDYYVDLWEIFQKLPDLPIIFDDNRNLWDHSDQINPNDCKYILIYQTMSSLELNNNLYLYKIIFNIIKKEGIDYDKLAHDFDYFEWNSVYLTILRHLYDLSPIEIMGISTFNRITSKIDFNYNLLQLLNTGDIECVNFSGMIYDLILAYNLGLYIHYQ
jgi:hypothetical protein